MKSFLLTELVPVIGILLAIIYPKYTSDFLNSYLGKFVAIFVVIIYALYDVLYGVVLCLLLICFYELNWNSRSMPALNLFDIGDIFKGTEGFDGISEILTTATFEPMVTHDSLTEFRDSRCKGGELYYRGLKVNPEMAEHVYPDIHYAGGRCNPCDPNCVFSLSLNKIAAEEEVVKPRSSNEFVGPWLGPPSDTNNNNYVFLPNVGTVSPHFSVL